MKRKEYYRLLAMAGLIGGFLVTVGVTKVTNVNEVRSDEYTVLAESEKSVEIQEEIEVIPVITEEPVEVIIEPVRQEINDDFDVLQPSNLTEEDLMLAINDEYRYRLIPIIGDVVEAEKTYGVNSLYLLSKLGLESGWGKHTTGDYNLGGWKDYYTGDFKDFESYNDCVMTIAKGVSNGFKDDVGSRLVDVAWRYCKDDGYIDSLKQIMSMMTNRIF